MLFTEDPAYFNGVPPAEGGTVAGAPPTTTSSGNGSGPPHASKLNSWSGSKRNNSKEGSGPPGGFNGSEDEKAWNNNRNTTQEQRIPWSDPDQMGTPSSLEGEFMSMNMGGNGGPPKGPPNGMPQWGRAEVNQSTPWETDQQRGGGGFVPPDGMPGSGPRFMPPVGMDTGTNHWRSWDHDGGFQKDFHGGPGGFPPMGVPNKMPGQFYPGANNFVMQPNFNDRMMRNGPPHMAAQQQHPWMGDKFGGPQGGSGRGFPQNQGFGGPPQAGPLMGPPQMGGHQRGYMPPPPLGGGHPHGHSGPHHNSGPHGGGPHPQHHHGGGPPPPMHPLAGGGPGKGGPNDMGGGFVPNYGGVHGQGNFDVGTFKAPTNMVNDDAVWHDPNGYLRKWQRDTGTAAWGDPSKQSGQPIRRWQNVDENDPLSSGAMPVGSASGGMAIGPIGSGSGANGSGSGPQQSSPDSLKKEEDEIAETGWGELPPLNGQSVASSSSGPTGMMGGGPPNPTLGPPPMAAGHQPNPAVGSGAWMGGGPGGAPMNPQSSIPQAGVSGWADSQQRSLASNNFIPPGNPFPPNPNFYGGNPAAAGPPGSEWARPPFGAAGTPFDGGLANGGGGPPGSTNEIADKLRLAAAKGLINPVLFCNSGKLSTQTASLLNTMINLLTQVEQQDVRIDHMKRNGGVGTPEFERLVRETSDAKNQLSDLRDKIHASIDNRPKGVSLADELTDMNTMPIGSEGQLFLNF